MEDYTKKKCIPNTEGQLHVCIHYGYDNTRHVKIQARKILPWKTCWVFITSLIEELLETDKFQERNSNFTSRLCPLACQICFSGRLYIQESKLDFMDLRKESTKYGR